jgi:hypothetical protein
MKKSIILFLFLLTGVGSYVYAQNKGPEFKFESETHDFGVIKRGPPAEHKFEFTNVGNTPIVIMDVTPSCGCTNVDWSKNPVLPGQKGFISLNLKTEEQHGVFKKEVYIKSNAYVPNGEKRYTIYIKGNAVDDDATKK